MSGPRTNAMRPFLPGKVAWAGIAEPTSVTTTLAARIRLHTFDFICTSVYSAITAQVVVCRNLCLYLLMRKLCGESDQWRDSLIGLGRLSRRNRCTIRDARTRRTTR